METRTSACTRAERPAQKSRRRSSVDPQTAHTRLHDKLDELEHILSPLGQRFSDAGFELALVGGSVRDALLGRPMPDLDFTTDARPDDILELISDWVDTHRDIGQIGSAHV